MTITATSVADPSVAQSLAVTLADPVKPPVITLSLTGATTVTLGTVIAVCGDCIRQHEQSSDLERGWRSRREFDLGLNLRSGTLYRSRKNPWSLKSDDHGDESG